MKVKHFTLIGIIFIVAEIYALQMAKKKSIIDEEQYFIYSFSTTGSLLVLIFSLNAMAAAISANEPDKPSSGGAKPSLIQKTMDKDVEEVTVETASQIWKEIMLYAGYIMMGYQIIKNIKKAYLIIRFLIDKGILIYNKIKTFKDYCIYYIVIGFLKIKDFFIRCWEFIKTSAKNIFNFKETKIYA